MSIWLLLRGLTRESRHWEAFPQMLCAAFSGIDVVAPDLPGNGTRCAETSPDLVGGMVDVWRAGLTREGRRPPYFVVAMSLGAMVAWEWAHRFPGEIRGMVLINTSLRPFSPFHQRLRLANCGRLLGLIADWHAPVGSERRILSMTSQQHADDPALLERWAEWRRQYPVSHANALRQLRAAAAYRAPPWAPVVPTLLLAGAGDLLVDSRCSADIARACGLPLRVHPGAGHDLPLDDPAWVVEQIAAWQSLRAVEAGAQSP